MSEQSEQVFENRHPWPTGLTFQCAYCQQTIKNPDDHEIQKHFEEQHPEMTGR